jgi:hypothetical protein
MTSDSAGLQKRADALAASGDFAQAFDLLSAATKLDGENVDLWLKLAAICRVRRDAKGALEATDRALAVDPLHFVALLLRANLLESAGSADADEAYGRALAQRPSTPLHAQITAMTAHAERRYSAYQQAENDRLQHALPANGVIDQEEQERLDRFRTNAVRLTRPYHSEPTNFHFPGLPEREFHDRSAFEWIEKLEAVTEIIAADFVRVAAAERVELVPYVQYPKGAPLRQWEALNHSSDWSAIHLLQNGKRIDANARHCAATMEILAALPQPDMAGISPNAMFSLLAPGAKIPPHTGVANTRLVCHLPLIVPDGCWFRVGADRRPWVRGQAWVFDDTIEHEAANESDMLRVVFICDVWHPGLSSGERAGVKSLIEAFARTGASGI